MAEIRLKFWFTGEITVLFESPTPKLLCVIIFVRFCLYHKIWVFSDILADFFARNMAKNGQNFISLVT